MMTVDMSSNTVIDDMLIDIPAFEDTENPHAEDCYAAEALLSEYANDAERLTQQVADLTESLHRAQAEHSNLLALYRQTNKKLASVTTEMEGHAQQSKFLAEEYLAMEARAMAETTIMAAEIDKNTLTAIYRAESGVARGPVPPSVTDAVQNAKDRILTRMHATGVREMRKVVTQAVQARQNRHRS